ncbi:ECF transporter S component [Mycoplasmopsis synoviae]|uniref:ECF transporter S component n=1 Tax=Mycoplasmopsis synoviae TaxID=2109 RepID=UPI0012A8B452|nr:ECF transporter S component [Mycoplasmopsis synoviae]QGL45484.1 ECF transporter S component [Mycoplasmopsis synoviae]QXV99305.1 ECF transporter S component [Mycoplasmopsis synoviae]UBM43487.1 ECF transporter S component [Mycoplasmopsis synoviae]UZW63601.1 ECF transporter S component [Mycoplasmopsis synoviae]
MKNFTEKVGKFFKSSFPGKWTTRKIVFVAILIAVSVTFTIISVQIAPFAGISTYKVAFIGLPVKISGFIFGPVIGIFIGLVSDLISLIYIPPTTYNPLYTLVVVMNGFIPGLFSWFFFRFINYAFGADFRTKLYKSKIQLYSTSYLVAVANPDSEKEANYYASKIIYYNNKKEYIKRFETINLIKNINLIIALMILSIIILFEIITIGFLIPDAYLVKSPVKNRWIIVALITTGLIMMMSLCIYGKFKIKSSRYLVMVPIIIFSAVLEIVNLPILSFADLFALGNSSIKDIFLWIFQHVFLAPVKIWFNIIIIYYSFSIISKLVNKNADLSWNTSS